MGAKLSDVVTFDAEPFEDLRSKELEQTKVQVMREWDALHYVEGLLDAH